MAGRPAAERLGALAVKELAPPSPAQWPAIKADLRGLVKSAQKMAFLDVTVKEAAINTLVAADVVFCFFIGAAIARGGDGDAVFLTSFYTFYTQSTLNSLSIGEIIGRGSIIGYAV